MEPAYLSETLTKRDIELVDYAKGLGMLTVTNNCVPQVLIPKDDGGLGKHNLLDTKTANEIFEPNLQIQKRPTEKSRFQSKPSTSTWLEENTTKRWRLQKVQQKHSFFAEAMVFINWLHYCRTREPSSN